MKINLRFRISLFLFLSSFFLSISSAVLFGEPLFSKTTILATQPYSLIKKGRFRKNPKCRKLYKGYLSRARKRKLLKEEYEISNEQLLLKQINKLYDEVKNLKGLHEKKCSSKTTKALKEAFNDAVRKLAVELEHKDFNAEVYSYPSLSSVHTYGDVELEGLQKEDSQGQNKIRLGQMLEDINNTLDRILQQYHETFTRKDQEKIESTKTPQNFGSPERESDSEDLDNLDNMDDDNSQMSAEDLEVLEVVANAEMRESFKTLFDVYLTDGNRQFIAEPYVNPGETTRLDGLFSHYYHIWRPNVAEQVLRIHLFFLDATQLDPETGSYPVYSKKTRPVAWKGRKTDYTGSLGKELSFVVAQFAASK